MPTATFNGKQLDARPDRIDLRDREYQPRLRSLPQQFPDHKQIKQHFGSYAKAKLILDQGEEGACTGFGLAAVINYLRWRQAKDSRKRIPPKVSERMLYHLAKQYDEWPGEEYEGSSCRGAMKGWHRHGVCEATTWPYRDKKGAVVFLEPKAGWDSEAAFCPLGAYYRINKDSITDMQAAIYEVGAVYVSANVHEGWFPRQNRWKKATGIAIIQLPKKVEQPGGHAFAIVGYNDLGFIVQNSWGPTWGTHGFAILTYPDWVQHGMDAWVAALGSPMIGAKSRRYQTKESLVRSSTEPAQFFGIFEKSTSPHKYKHPEVAPWDSDTAYDHSVVLGNNGTVLNRSLVRKDALSSLHEILVAMPTDWLSKGGTKLALYAHGGLNSEEDSIERIRIMAPYFKANNLYPIFFTWRTGFQESLLNIMGDATQGVEPQGAWKDIWDSMKDAAKEAKDRAVEVACQNLLVKAVWAQMKQNAQAAATLSTPTLGLVTAALVTLKAQFPKLEIHLVGHSAGSILLGYLLDFFIQQSLPARTCTLFAPACTTRFALNHYKPAIEAPNILRKSDVVFEILNDKRERGDSVGPYGKSLLYLVSRALEDYHKTPLLGMARAWDPSSSKTDWHSALGKTVQEWCQFWGNGKSPTEHSEIHVSDGVGEISLAHGSFDNDIVVMTRTLERILGKNLTYPIENLKGY